MLPIIITILTTSVILLLVANFTDGFEVDDWGSAIVGAIVLAIINATVGKVLTFLAFPFLILTLGLFIFVINAFLLQLTAKFVSGIKIRNFTAALIASLLISLFTTIANILL